MRLRDLQPQPYGKEQPACVNRRVANRRLGPLIRLSPEKLPTLIEQARTSYFLILVSRFGLLLTFAPSHLENRIQREVCYVSLLRLQGFGSQFPVFAYRWILLSVVKDQGALSDIPDWRVSLH